MPVYLPPITRRRFLKNSLAVSAVAAAGGCAVNEFSVRGDSWALLSDTHIAADPNTVHSNVNMARNLQRVTQEALAWPEPISGALINGDLAYDSGAPADYAAFLDLIEPMRKRGWPIYLSLGNHDHREHFWSAMPRQKATEAGLPDRQITIIRAPHANWFVLDSLIKTLEIPGNLGEAQREWLARVLDQNADKPALVAVHHNPNPKIAPGTAPAAKPHGLEDTEELLAILRPRLHVKAYFFGHTHRWSVSADDSGLHLINFPPVAYVFQPGQPSGWVYAAINPQGASIEIRCLDRTHAEHGRVVDLKWRG